MSVTQALQLASSESPLRRPPQRAESSLWVDRRIASSCAHRRKTPTMRGSSTDTSWRDYCLVGSFIGKP